MNGTQCDTCRTFSQVSTNWLFLVRMIPATGIFSWQQTGQEIIGSFCSASCLADFSYLRAVTEEKPADKKESGQ